MQRRQQRTATAAFDSVFAPWDDTPACMSQKATSGTIGLT